MNTTLAQKTGIGAIAGFTESTHLNNFRFVDENIELDIQPEFKNNFHAGLIYRYVFGRNIRMQTEPLFIKMGATYNDTFIYNDTQFETDSETELWYFQVPVLVQFTTTPPDRAEFPKPWPEFTYHFTAGGYGGYLLDATFSGSNRGAPFGVVFEDTFFNNVKDQYYEFDYGVVFGGGLEFGLNTKIGFETRLIYGLADVGNDEVSNFNPKNVAINFSVYFIL